MLNVPDYPDSLDMLSVQSRTTAIAALAHECGDCGAPVGTFCHRIRSEPFGAPYEKGHEGRRLKGSKMPLHLLQELVLLAKARRDLWDEGEETV